MIALLALALLQDAPEVRVGKKAVPVSVRAREAERGPAVMSLGEIERGRGVLFAYPRDRHLHFYFWTRGEDAGQRRYDVAWIDSKGRVLDVTALQSEYLPDPRPSWGINKIRGLTSPEPVQYALFMGPNQASRLGIRRGAETQIALGGIEIEPMPAIELGDKRIRVQVLATEPERSRGLSYRTNLSDGDGLLFAWPDARVRPIWMYHTFLSIDVTYLDGEGKILEIHPMKKMADPNDEAMARRMMTPTKAEAPYILETAYGWMEKNGFRVGDTLKLPDAVTGVTPEKSPFE